MDTLSDWSLRRGAPQKKILVGDLGGALTGCPFWGVGTSISFNFQFSLLYCRTLLCIPFFLQNHRFAPLKNCHKLLKNRSCFSSSWPPISPIETAFCSPTAVAPQELSQPNLPNKIPHGENNPRLWRNRKPRGCNNKVAPEISRAIHHTSTNSQRRFS
jgi:hypothetical protein